MKIIKGFENEDIIVSDFGEWVGNDYIDYKAEYKRNQKFIEMLFDENKQLKDNWNKLKDFLETWEENEEYCYLASNPMDRCRKDIYRETLDKMQELEQGSD